MLLPFLLVLQPTAAVFWFDRSGNSTAFSNERAKTFLKFSSAAYCDEESISNWTCHDCLAADPSFTAKLFTDAKTTTQAYVGRTNGETTENIVVAFRGSETIENWVTNLNFPKVGAYPKCDGCKVHEGFLEAWNSVREPIVAEVKRLLVEQPKAQVFVTGHSLGAALAALCAAELGASSHSLGFPIEGVYTYGQPRVGNQAFADFYDTGTHVSWRVTHWRDPVPHLPTQSLGFHHTSNEVFYSKDSKTFKVCDNSGEDANCSDKFLLDTSIADHLDYMGGDCTCGAGKW
jgi:hypothetical protein